jgi:phospholipid transport system substrate-binding protein
MIDRRRLILTALFAPLFGRTVGATSEDGAVQLIEWLSQQALAILSQQSMSLEEREAAFRVLLHKGFDLDFIGRFVLGTTWRRATPAQRADYLDLFGEFIVKTYAKRLDRFSGEALVVLKATVAGKKRDVIVSTRIDRPSGPPLKVAWRVRRFDNQDKIIDVLVQGVSMAVTQRQEFASVTRRSGLEGLLQILRARTERLPAMASR